MVSNVVTTLTLGEDDYTLEDHMVLNDWENATEIGWYG